MSDRPFRKDSLTSYSTLGFLLLLHYTTSFTYLYYTPPFSKGSPPLFVVCTEPSYLSSSRLTGTYRNKERITHKPGISTEHVYNPGIPGRRTNVSQCKFGVLIYPELILLCDSCLLTQTNTDPNGLVSPFNIL